MIYIYTKIFYESEKENFSLDGSLINHKDSKQIWLLVNISTKEFRIEASYSRHGKTLSKFINLYIEIVDKNKIKSI